MRNLIAIAFLLFCLIYCKSTNSEKKQNATTPKPQEIKQVLGIARIEPEGGLLDLYASNNGRVVEILVKENQEVEKGEILAVIDFSKESLQMEQCKAKLATQEALLQTNTASVKSAKISAQKAARLFDQNRLLAESKAVTPQNLENSKDDAEKLIQDYEITLGKLKESEQKLQEIKSELAVYANDVKLKKITAPYAGKILSLDLHVGDIVSTGSKIGQFAPKGNLIALTEVDELFEERIKIGQKASIISQASNEEIGKGEVSFIAQYLKKKSLFADESNTEDRRVKTVKIWLSNTGKFTINSRVDCIIYLK